MPCEVGPGLGLLLGPLAVQCLRLLGGPRSSRAGGMLRGPSGSGGVSQGGAGDGEAQRDSRAGLRGPLRPGFRWDSPSWLWGQGQGLRGGEGRRVEDGGHSWDVVRVAWVRRSRQS